MEYVCVGVCVSITMTVDQVPGFALIYITQLLLQLIRFQDLH